MNTGLAFIFMIVYKCDLNLIPLFRKQIVSTQHECPFFVNNGNATSVHDGADICLE